MDEPDPAPAERDESLPSETPSRSLQFRISTMLWLTLVVALACSLFFSIPAVAGLPLLLAFSMVLPAVLATIAIYGRGYQRTFCIGAMFPAGVLLFTLGFLHILILDGPASGFIRFTDDARWLGLRVIVGGSWGLSLLAGLICVGVRRLVEKPPTKR